MRPITTLQEAEAALQPYLPSRLKRLAYTTDHMRAFMDFLGNPQHIPRAIHIAGTSGKTSTAYYAAALLRQAGKRTGLMVSPHVQALTERIQIDLEPLPEKEFCSELTIFLDLVAKSGIKLTYNEILYAFAFWEFARHNVKYIIVETGLGGLLDATNIIDRSDKICLITDIGFDHTRVLGTTLEEIARHKAGIIGLHNTVFCFAQPAAIEREIRSACQRNHADLHTVTADKGGIAGLAGFQQRNCVLAASAVRFISEREGRPLADDHIARAAQLIIPGRMELVELDGRTIILDGAHNAQKMQALRQSLTGLPAVRPISVLAALTDKPHDEAAAILLNIAAFADHLIATSLPPLKDGRASMPPDEIIRLAAASGLRSAQAVPGTADAFTALLQRPEPTLVVTGSFYLLQHIRPLVIRQNAG